MYTSDLFPQRLKEGRAYRGLSQKEVADELKINAVSFGRYELSKANVNAVELPKIANLLRLDIRFFFDPDLKIEDCDLDYKKEENTIKLLVNEVKEIKEKINPSIDYDGNEIISNMIKLSKKLNNDELYDVWPMIKAIIEVKLNSRSQQVLKKRTAG